MRAASLFQPLVKTCFFAGSIVFGLPALWATSKLNWEGAIGLTVNPGGSCSGSEALSASQSHVLSENSCERVRLIVSVSGLVEKVDSGFDVVSVNGIAVFEGDDAVDPDCDEDMMTQKNGSVTIEVGPGESITLSYSTNDGLYNAGAQAEITDIVEAPIQGDCKTCGGGNSAGGNGLGGANAASGVGGMSSGGISNFGGSSWGSNSSGQSAFAVGIGGASSAYGSASLNAEANPLSAMSGDRGGLSYIGADENHIAQRFKDGSNKLTQIKGKAGLIDLEDISGGSGYEMRFYDSSQVGGFDSGQNKYALTGSPVKVISVVRQVTGSTSTVTYTETVGGGSPAVLWSNSVNTATNTYTSTEFGGQRITVTVKTTLSGTRRKERVTVKSIINSIEKVYAITDNIYEMFGWGEEMVETAADPDGANLRMVSTYYTSQVNDGDSYGLQRSILRPNGDWILYKNYDADGSPGKTVRSFNSNAFDSSSTGESSNRLEVIVKTQADEDGDTIADVTRERSNYLKGQLIGRSWETRFSKIESKNFYDIDFSGQVTKRQTETAVSASAARGAVGNATVVDWHDNISKQRLVRTSPEGVSSLTHDYHYGSSGVRLPRAISASGRLDSGGSYLIAGIRDARSEDQTGNLSVNITDVSSGADLFWQYPSNLDAQGRAQRMNYYDGSYEDFDYGCCGLDERRNRDGSQSVFLRDSFGRINEIITYVDGSFVSAVMSEMDALGRVVRTLRRSSATDNSPQITGENDYDLAGRLQLSEDALGRPTDYDYAIDGGGRPILTITYPSGGTRIETREKDGALVSIAGTAVAPKAYVEDVDSAGRYRIDYRIGVAGAQAEWVRTDYDFMGRAWKTSYPYPSGAATTYYFDMDGRVIRTVDADGVGTLTRYDLVGRIEYSAVDIDGSGEIEMDETDRVTRFEHDIEGVDGRYGERVTTYAAVADGSAGDRLVSRTTSRFEDRAVLRSVDGSGITTRNYEYRTYDYVITDTFPDGRIVEAVYKAGRKDAETAKKGSVTLSSLSYQYDTYNRLWKVVDAAFGTKTYAYYDDDQLETVITADPDTLESGEGYDAQVIGYEYDTAGRLWKTTMPDGKIETRTYHPTGQLDLVYGGDNYPRRYFYDTQARIKTLTTWQSFNPVTQIGSGEAVTTWSYHASRGWLENKKSNNNLGTSYTYTAGGRLHVRTWARTLGGLPLTTTYGYDDGGSMESIDYSDDTEDVLMTYDREGRLWTVTDKAGVLTRSYNPNNHLDDDVYSGSGLLSGRSITRTFDAYLRPESISTGSDYSVAWGFSGSDGRLEVITYNSQHSAQYGYRASSFLGNNISYRDGSTVRGGVSMTHDNLARIQRIDTTASAISGGLAARRDYRHDDMGRRKTVTHEDGAYWTYGYDDWGQVDSAIKKTSANAVIPGYSYGFEFDDIGNRKSATRGDYVDTYEADLLNQYTRRTTAGMVEVRGGAAAGLTVLVNDQLATRSGNYFYRATEVDNDPYALNAELKIQAVRLTPTTAVATETRGARIDPALFTPAYDADGNPTIQGVWVYEWDAENRLIAAETNPSVAGSVSSIPRTRVEFLYDGFSRRISKIVKVWNTSPAGWAVTQERRYLYDNWNKILEYNPLASGATVLRHVWGVDASGTAQGAGGVGGLLFTQSAGGVYAPGYDANGNVIVWLDMATGDVAGRWEYGVFGETLTSSGVARDLPHSFSTKHRDAETGLFDYGHRSYDSTSGRFLGRDPVAEDGGLNLFAMVRNNPINFWDFLGLIDCDALRKQLGIASKIYDNQRKNFEAGGDYADQIGLLDGTFLDNVSNTNALTGLGVAAVGSSIAGSVASDGTKGPYGQTYYSGSTPWQGQKAAIAGTALGVAGIGIDAYQAANSFSSGDNLGGIKSTASGALGGIGLAIAASNPVTATAAGIGALAINAAETGANAYLNYRGEQWRQENAAKSASLLKNAAGKIRDLNDQLIQNGCNNCLGMKVK